MGETDTISRQAAIDALEREKTYCTAFREGYAPINVFEKYNAGLTDGIKALKNLPSAQPEQRWIPCSERLPKPFEHCLWTTTDGRVVYHHCDGLFSNYTAWMPLPEPYAERRADETQV